MPLYLGVSFSEQIPMLDAGKFTFSKYLFIPYNRKNNNICSL